MTPAGNNVFALSLKNCNPSSTVFIGGVQVGKTPYSGTRDTGEISLRLVPDALEKPLVPYETRVSLSPGIQTVVKREFGETIDASAGEVISF